MREIWHSFIRASAFLRKEIVNVLRQPRLVLTLVLGPFVILLVYGLGFREEARPIQDALRHCARQRPAAVY